MAIIPQQQLFSWQEIEVLGDLERLALVLQYCPAHHYGINCAGKEQCPVNKAIRIPLEEDPRIFTPVARSSYKWKDLYKMRTATERVNSRLDVSFGFERHFIRGQRKMELRACLALCVMLDENECNANGL